MHRRCSNCFMISDGTLEICPFCGHEDGDPGKEPYFLYPGTVLNGRYTIGEARGFGGFGITYKAWDNNLNIVVAIKEYYYAGIATREPGSQEVRVYAQNRKAEFRHFLNRFLDEARYTAKFSQDTNVVNVFEFFESNSTAYIVMEFLDGIPLNEYLKNGAMDAKKCISVMKSICSALKTLHADDVIHRDVSPDNIMVCTNGKVKLFDFGAARFSKDEEQHVTRLTQVMKPGFSPPEQYQSVSKQGPWTDVYALGATLYYMATGKKPIESTNRKTKDDLVPPAELRPDLPEYINDTILRAMAIDPHLRFSSVDEFEKALFKEKKVFGVVEERRRRIRNRILGLSSAFLLVVTGFMIFIYIYHQQILAEALPDSRVEIWISLPDGDEQGEAKTNSFEAIIAEFNVRHPNVVIELIALPEDEYLGAVNDALGNNSLPQLFESGGVGENVLNAAQSAQAAIEEADLSNVLFYSEYELLFPDFKQFPLGFAMPVRYINATVDGGGEGGRDMFLAGA